jgi:hypothetical protein
MKRSSARFGGLGLSPVEHTKLVRNNGKTAWSLGMKSIELSRKGKCGSAISKMIHSAEILGRAYAHQDSGGIDDGSLDRAAELFNKVEEKVSSNCKLGLKI